MAVFDQLLMEAATVPLSTLVLGSLIASCCAMVFALLAALRSGTQRTSQLEQALANLALGQERFERAVADTLARSRAESHETARHLREEVASSIRQQSGQLLGIQQDQHAGFEQRLAALSEAHRLASEALRTAVDTQLTSLRHDNSAKLEAMRMTVDEKLQGTLEQRLGESFKLVSERLDAVHKGLGEMQTLAAGVGDLKRVLTNVKSRGSWGEVQLGALLEQILTPAQFVANAVMAETGSERVEYAIVLPGDDRPVFLPIDAKFPVEDYQRLQAAADIGNAELVETASRALERRLKDAAATISAKYIVPPRTTDFAIMFLPTEGLYAEALRRPGLVDELQNRHRVIIAGPTTLTAILSSLQMGFRTLAIQERSSEVWQVLGAVKAEFGTFGDILGSVKKKLHEASNHIEKAETRSRAISRKLRDVEVLPGTAHLLGPVDRPPSDEDVEAVMETPFLHRVGKV